MEHLFYVLYRTFPNRMLHIREQYQSDDVYNMSVGYEIRVEDLYNRRFDSFNKLKKFVYKICEEHGTVI